MPHELPNDINKKKNKLHTKSAWLWLLDIDIEDVDDTLRFVNNNENIVYDGNTYIKCNFELGEWNLSESGRLPNRTLNITNADLIKFLLPYNEDYDGIVGSIVTVTPVNSDHLDLDVSSKAQEYIVLQSSPGEDWISYTLGSPNPLNQRFPLSRYFGLHCRFVAHFRGVECKYDGSATTCNGTLKQCKEYGNETNFGGCPGLRSKTVRFV